MFKKLYDSLSTPVHMELLVHADHMCLKAWSETLDYTPTNLPEKSLTFDNALEYGKFPPDVTGIYHTKLPAGDGVSQPVSGAKLHAAMPAEIKGSYEDIKDKLFSCISYAWIDPTDPSISGGELGDMACWTIGVRQDGRINRAFNAIAASYQTKAHPLRTSRQFGGPAALFVYKPFESDGFDECSLTLKYNKAFGFSTNVLDGWTVGANEKELFKSYDYVGHLHEAFPHFVVTSGGESITADGSDIVNFKMVDNDDTLIEEDSEAYLESTGGYLPKTRVPVTDGLGSFKVTALGLESGDEFKVKIGFRNLTGMHDVSYTVS